MISFSNKVYKGYATYSEAHQVWGAFVNHNTLPPDILNGLYSRPRPLPPTLPRPDIRGLAKPSSPTPLQPSPTPLQALAATGHPLRPISTLFAHHPEAFGMPTTLSTATISASPSVPESAIQKMSTQDGSSSKQSASDAKDFWVVFTGASPGVYQGRENGECAFGLLTSPFFLRIESREEANQIFVDGYMNHSVTCFV
ncbi:hypothetical protein K443DRAFT_4279 [Laccaria amethystina LaAM-08-1]|uniref:Uncharacterized protein n=1 Tax=Laccaria amethystina LaAM-08-1 TaxID=1095629 RepID=A0A0C9Y4A3_9AGAR|nr:hypothetical protein K443DRAFT_4279 [Laccaria amethystina LaAM-08-1]